MDELHGCSCKGGTWEATRDEMPPNSTHTVRVTGTCTCPTEGYKARLVRADPQGINKDILLLRLETTEPTDGAADKITDYAVDYEESGSRHTQVTIEPCDITIDISITT